MNIKLPTESSNELKALVQARKVLYGSYDARQLINDMLAAYKAASPQHAATAEKYLEVMADKPDAPIASSKRGVIKISQPIEGYKVEKGVS